MDRAKRVAPLVLVAVLLSCLALPAGYAAGEGEDFLLIHGVQPAGDCEWVTLFNHGRNDVKLSGYVLSDGEGTVTFSASVTLPGKTQITVFSSKPPGWAPTGPSVFDGKGAKFSGFKLADAGDQVQILKEGRVMDAFAYGCAGGCDGWVGETFGKIPKNGYAERASPFDTDTAADWVATVPGRGNFDLSMVYDACVAPFSFPESEGEPVAQTISWAEREILISVYVLTHVGIAMLLEDALYRGVSVSILVEGAPVGGIPEKSASLLKTLADLGAEVNVVAQDEGFRRFQYVHCKYAVVDGRYVVISSENWTETSFSKNRGWGLIIDSEDYAALMRDVHISDSSPNNPDVFPFLALYPKVTPIDLEPWPWSPVELEWFSAAVEPVLSPNNSGDAMREFITSARERAYSQQLSFPAVWPSPQESPTGWMSQASLSGTDVRLLVDNSFQDNNGFSLRDSAIEMFERGIDVRFSPRFDNGGITHNKGIVIDDSVWIGSINWTWNSLHNNREAASIIHSEAISDYFAKLFLYDWERSVGAEGLVRVECSGTMVDGSPFSLRLGGINEGECLWEINNDVFIGNPIILTLGHGEYNCRVTVDGMETVDFTIWVDKPLKKAIVDPIWMFFSVGAMSLVALLFKRKGKIGG